MSRDEIFEKACQVIARVFAVPADSFGKETRMEDIEGWTSLNHLVLITGFEKAFDVDLPRAKVGDGDTVGQLVDLIYSCVSKRR
jgi:acyl carrier protein